MADLKVRTTIACLGGVDSLPEGHADPAALDAGLVRAHAALAIRMPNGALASLAGNVDPHHHVAIADLVLAQSSVRPTVERLMRELQPDLVGLSVMTFQRGTARRIISLIRSLDAGRRASSSAATIRAWRRTPGRIPTLGVDFIVRGEGDLTFRELVRALESGAPLVGGRRALVSRRRRLPAQPAAAGRGARGRRRSSRRTARPACSPATRCSAAPVDVVETSRGCTFDCSFCSIIEMRGRNFHRFPIDARDRRHRATPAARGARAIFLVDDNITLDVAALRGAVPRHHRRRPRRHRLHRAGR